LAARTCIVDDSHLAQHRNTVVYAIALLGPAALGAILYGFRDHVAAANLALVFVVGIVAVAAGTGQRGAAAVAAVSSALSFDFFCTQPYLSFRITSSSDLTTEILLVVVGLAVGELAARGRQARVRAAAGTGRLERVHGLGERIAMGEDPQFVIMAVAQELREVLSLRDCRFTWELVTDAAARIEPDGSVTMIGRLWKAEKLGLPTRKVELPVRGGGRMLGAFLLTPSPALPVERDSCLLAVALADQLGAILASRRLAG
jgi:K+-sensing histidine kinase KdpD